MCVPAAAEFERYINIIRGWDSSPRDVELGDALTELLAPAARCRHLREDGKWELVPYDRAKELGIRHKRGVLETYASCADLLWAERRRDNTPREELPAAEWEAITERVETLFSGCSFIQDTTAGTYLEAWDDNYEQLSMAAIFEMAENGGRNVAINISADMAARNVCFVLEIIEKLVEFNARMRAARIIGRALALISWCRGHIIMTAIIGMVQFKQVVQKIYSVSFALRFPPRFRRFGKILQDRLERDLVEGAWCRLKPTLLGQITLKQC